MIQTSINIDEIKKHYKNVKEEAIKKGMISAINEVIASAKTESRRIITSEYEIRAGEYNKIVKTTKANTKIPEAKIIVKDKQMGYSDKKTDGSPKWKAVSTKKGVKIKVKKGRDKILTHAFLATMKNGHRGVYERDITKSKTRIVGKSKMGKEWKDYPIREIKGPSIAYLFSAENIKTRLIEYINRKLPAAVDRNINYWLKKMGK